MKKTAAKLGGNMRWIASGVGILAGVMGMAAEAVEVAENRGLPPIIKMKPSLSLLVVVIAGGISFAAQAGQLGGVMGQKARPDPVTNGNERKMGVCFPVDNSPGLAPHGGNVFTPLISAFSYFRLYEHQKIPLAATVTILQNPKHGGLGLVTEADRGTLFSKSSGPLNPAVESYAYIPEQGYLGNDSATIQVDFGGKIIKVVYYFKVVDHPVGNDGDMEICKTGPYWKISSTLDSNGTNTITSIEYQSPTTSATGTIVGNNRGQTTIILA